MSEPRVIDGWELKRDGNGWYAKKGDSFFSRSTVFPDMLNISVKAEDWPPPDAVFDELRRLEASDAD